MVEKDSPTFGLFVGLPGGKEITHDQNQIPPALDVLVPALRLQMESRIAQTTDVLMIAQAVTSKAGKLFEQRLNVGLVLVYSREVAIPHGQSGENLGRNHFKLAVRNAGLGMHEIVEGYTLWLPLL